MLKGIEVKNADKLKALLSEVMVRNRRSNVDVKFTQRKANTIIVELSNREQQLYADISRLIRSYYLEQHPVFSRFQMKNLQEQMGSSFSAITGTLQKLAVNQGLEPELQWTIQDYCERALEIAKDESMQSEKLQELTGILSSFGDKMLIFNYWKINIKWTG